MRTCLSRRLLLRSLPLLLAACSQPQTAVPRTDPYANGADYPWSYTAPQGRLTTLSLTPGENNLYYEPILAARNGWGPIEIDRSNGEQRAGDGRTLTLSGKTYARGFGTHAYSELRYSLKGTGATCNRFTADIGVDDEVGSRGSVVFQVYLDGVQAYDSGRMTGSSATKSVSVDITGKQELRLVVTDGGDGKSYDHADWAIPRISCQATPTPPSGTLDPSFGTGGVVPVGGRDAVLEPGNNLLIADTANGDFVLRRLTPGGQVQQVTTDLGGQDTANALVRQPDGKVVVVGQSGNDFAAARYNPDLTLDPGFGRGGKVVTDLGGLPTGTETASAVTLQADGRIVVAGTTVAAVPQAQPPSQDLAVVRYLPGGQLDPAFGTGGVAVQRFDPPAGSIDYTVDEARAVAVQPDGKIVVAGRSDAAGGGRQWLLTRLNADGRLDTGFASGGAVRGGNYGIFNGLALEPDGRIVVVGYEGRYFGDGVVRRYSPQGALLDRATVNFTAPAVLGIENVLSDVLILPGGQLVVGGRTQPNAQASSRYGVARLNPDLSPDLAFGNGGLGLAPVGVTGLESPLSALLRQPDGKVVVVAAQSARFFP